MRQYIFKILLTAFILTPTAVYSQHNNSAAYQNYQRFQKNAKKDYDDFRMKANKAFIEGLAGEWLDETLQEPEPAPQRESLPPREATPEDLVVESRQHQADLIEPLEMVMQPGPLATITSSMNVYQDQIEFSVYGTPCKVRFQERQKFELPDVFCGTLSKAWEKMLTPEYDNTLYDCLKLRDEMALCDWAYLRMLLNLSEEALGTGNEARLLAAFLYSQSGYRMRLVTNENGLHMLFATEYSIPNHQYLDMEGKRYYALTPLRGAIKCMPVGMPKEQSLSLKIDKLPQFKNRMSTPAIHAADSIAIAVSVDQNLLEFYNDYPVSTYGNDDLTQWANYAMTPVDVKVKAQFYPMLMDKLQGRNELDAVNMLLSFVQHGFAYKEDPLVWGYERPFFFEETIFYPYCDCEDRAILFSHLVRDLTKLDVALIYYPNHLAAAVKFRKNVEGDFIQLRGEKYVICDPTFIGAPVGATMTGMNNATAKAVVLRKIQ